MIPAITAIVENGLLKLDQPLPYPDHTRVKLTIERVESENESLAAWNRLLEHLDQHPMVGFAAKFSRDALYERD